MKNLLIVGGTSAIATETAICFAKEDWNIYLADINIDRLNIVRNHIKALTGNHVDISAYDIADIQEQKKMFDDAISKLGSIDAVLIAYGTLPEQKIVQNNPVEINKHLFINFTSICNLLGLLSEYFESQNTGTIAVISSVAGDRGRQSNYIYGAAKGGLSIFLQGLRNRFSNKNIKIITIKPGFVDTPMTASMPKNPLYSSAEKIGKAIRKAMEKGEDIAYVPGFWRIIMIIIKHIPESIFKKLKL